MSDVILWETEKSPNQRLFFPDGLPHNGPDLPELSIGFCLPPDITFRE